mmetsp:Transcript_26728/g.74878  ORF Transcript_26728/g.74878 Transcript_26728/m.74878 type:complete len:296 (-) Transcript_26728:217-1104(-)
MVLVAHGTVRKRKLVHRRVRDLALVQGGLVEVLDDGVPRPRHHGGHSPVGIQHPPDLSERRNGVVGERDAEHQGADVDRGIRDVLEVGHVLDDGVDGDAAGSVVVVDHVAGSILVTDHIVAADRVAFVAVADVAVVLGVHPVVHLTIERLQHGGTEVGGRHDDGQLGGGSVRAMTVAIIVADGVDGGERSDACTCSDVEASDGTGREERGGCSRRGRGRGFLQSSLHDLSGCGFCEHAGESLCVLLVVFGLALPSVVIVVGVLVGGCRGGGHGPCCDWPLCCGCGCDGARQKKRR